jgi:molybdate transport system substrate-binding protein
LAEQIEAAAPADIFISADLDWMDYLAKKNLIKSETRANLLGNRLVLIAPANSAAKLGIAPNFPFLKRSATDDSPSPTKTACRPADMAKLPSNRSACGRPSPIGWRRPKNVRATLALVSRGEAPLGIVYQTDAASSKSVKIV